MGVVIGLIAVDDATIDQLVANPEEFGRFVMGGDLVFESTEEKANYFRNGILPASLRNAIRPESADMDKAWAGIDFVLRKFGDQKLRFITEGGRDIREVPKKRQQASRLLARAFSSSEVEQLNLALTDIQDQTFIDHLDICELKERDVYPFGFSDLDNDDRDYVVHWYSNMKEFVAQRVAKRQGMMVTDGG